jgi:UDP-GlcNAc:undecaprenyl-phosphate/decaprenyl-phosphate GlcNAc-1-phosphate transferase
MIYMLLAFGAALICTLWIVSSVKDENSLVFDTTVLGPQKFHKTPVPRIGGLAIFVGLAVAALMMWWQGDFKLRNAAPLLLCATPAFAVGLLEDLTKRVNPHTRMVTICMSALLACVVLEVSIVRVDLTWVDAVLRYWPFALVLTVFAVAGIVNAINIIDGFNGLALMSSVIMFAAIGWVAHSTADALVLTICLSAIGSLLGLFVFNYPNGRIFLGDGGAYLVGFVLACCAVLLFHRNPEVSPWFSILVLAYPTTETLFSAYRKKLVRKISPLHPDRAHLHMLVFGRLVRRFDSQGKRVGLNQRNSRTAPYMWLLCSVSVLPAVFLYDNPFALMVATALYVMVYIAVYNRLVRFKHLPLVWGGRRAAVLVANTKS